MRDDGKQKSVVHQKNKDKREDIQYFKVIQLVLLAGLIVYVGVILTLKGDSKTPFQEVSAKVEKAADVEAMKQGGAKELKQYYGLNEEDYEGVLFYLSGFSMGVEEILLLKVKSEAQMPVVEAAVDSRINSQKKSFEGYGAKQFELLNQAVVHVKGSYLLFVVSANAEDIQKAYKAVL